MSRAEKEKIYMGLCFLHGFEAILILLIIWAIFYPNNLALFIIIGFVFHQILDAIHLYSVKYNYDKVISFFYSLKNSKNKKLLQDIK
ncbi:hypothetical protein FJZ17_02505 [Candidatus Pacearchaeota archaeon]|nr:hypothetical protein [Candidatus Pacearchaeota archaeon]